MITSQMASLPSIEAPAFFANLLPFTSVTNAARETLVQVGLYLIIQVQAHTSGIP